MPAAGCTTRGTATLTGTIVAGNSANGAASDIGGNEATPSPARTT